MSRVLVLSGSPRAGGNSDAAADLAAAACGSAGADVLSLRLRDHPVRPCTGCGECAGRPGSCALDGPDDGAAALFACLARASVLVVTAPVYFYGLPAGLKALVDRCQRFWAQPLQRHRRPAFAVLIGARHRGDRLFEGSLLVLRCVLPVLGFSLRDPLLLRGLEEPDDLRRAPRIRAQVTTYAASASLRATDGDGPWDC